MKKLIYFVIVMALLVVACNTKKAPATETPADSTKVEVVDTTAVK